MSWRAVLPYVAVVMLAFATPAVAQERLVCFDPGTARLTPEGYVAVREAAGELEGPPFANVVIWTSEPETNIGWTTRADEVRLELVRAGASIVLTRIEKDDEEAPPDCLRLTRRANAGPAMWHFYGPYFDAGSDVVGPEWRSRMRFLTANYRPGETRYCVEGHSDTAASAEDSLAISRRRAENAARELVRLGVRWDDIRIAAFGETRIVRPTADGVFEPLNRRVHIEPRQSCPASFG